MKQNNTAIERPEQKTTQNVDRETAVLRVVAELKEAGIDVRIGSLYEGGSQPFVCLMLTNLLIAKEYGHE